MSEISGPKFTQIFSPNMRGIAVNDVLGSGDFYII